MSNVIKIAVIDNDTNTDPGELGAVVQALQTQVNRDFGIAPPDGYGLVVSVRIADEASPPDPSAWLLGLFQHPDQPGALGYHETTATGLPIMKVFPALDMADGVSWSSTASHELLETLADPLICRCVQMPDGKIWAYEVCDAVEADSYKIDTVEVSNFVRPIYFEPSFVALPMGSGARFDHLGLIRYSGEIRPGGYGQYWNGTTWKQVVAAQTPRNGRLLASSAGHSRTARRRKKV